MTDLQIRVETDKAISLFARISDNFPRARTWALNRTAEEVNAALQQQALSGMIFRGAPGRRLLNLYAPTRLPGPARARDNKPYATPVDPHFGGKILRPFETGAPKTPSAVPTKVGTAIRYPAIPTKAIRPWPRATIPRKFFPTNLYPATRQGAAPARPLKSGRPRRSKSWKDVRPFILDPARNPGLGPRAWGIYQRVGKGRGDIRMLWAFRHVVQRPKTLSTYDTARRITGQQWAPNMVGMFRNLVRLGRGKASILDLAA